MAEPGEGVEKRWRLPEDPGISYLERVVKEQGLEIPDLRERMDSVNLYQKPIEEEIQPTPDNTIPKNGFFHEGDSQVTEMKTLYDNFAKDPQNPEPRFALLNAIRKSGHAIMLLDYLKEVSQLPQSNLSLKEQIKELEMLHQAYMNVAVLCQLQIASSDNESQRVRNERVKAIYWHKGNVYREVAEQLKTKT